MKIENINIKDIKERDGNPNVMTKAQLEALMKSIQTFGELQPVIIDKNNKLIDGHQRKKAYEGLGMRSIPAIRLDLDKETDKKLLSQIMNKVKGKHDESLDAIEFKALLESEGMEELVDSLATSEQDILNILNKTEQQSNEELKNVEEVEQIGKLLITCPFCKKQFKKEDS